MPTNKWLLTEQLLKRVGPLREPDSIVAGETKKEPADDRGPFIQTLKEKYEEKPQRKETSNRWLSALLLIGVVLAFSVVTAILLSKVSSLQGQNRNLLKEYKELEQQIENLQERNRALTEKIDKAEQERVVLKASVEPLRQENEAIKLELAKAQGTAKSAGEEKAYLEEMLINKTKEIENLKRGAVVTSVAPTILSAPAAGSLEELTLKLNAKDQEIQRLTEQNKIISNKLDKLYRTTNDKMAAINIAKITLEDTIAEARKNIDNEWNTVDLGSITTAVNPATVAPTLKPAEIKKEPRTLAKKEGHVLAINEEHGFVVVDLGKVDGIDSTSALALKQNGEGIASLTVLEVRDVMTACNIENLKSGKKIAVNDSVSIRK